jgi:hypothetical protein
MRYNYEKEILIDQGRLDESWLDQPGLVLKYGMALAEAKAEEDGLKESAGLIRARAEIRHRRIMEENGEKVTDAVIKATVAKDKGVVQANQELLSATKKVRILEVAVKAFDQRKSALENLVKLFGMQYFSEPMVDIVTRAQMPGRGAARLKQTAEKIKKRKLAEKQRRPGGDY